MPFKLLSGAIANGVVASGSTPASSRGVVVTAPASANTKAAWTQLVSSTSRACSGLVVTITGTNPGANETVLVDIGTGAAASEVVLAPNLPAGGSAYTNVFTGHQYVIPATIAAGTRIAARYQSSRSASFGVVTVHVSLLYADGVSNYGTIETVGVSTGTTLGTSIDPGAAANTKGSWVSLGSTSKAWRKALVAVTSQATSAAVNDYSWMVDLATANDGSNIIIPDLLVTRHYATAPQQGVSGPFDVAIGSGATLYVRASCNSTEATIRNLHVAAVGC